MSAPGFEPKGEKTLFVGHMIRLVEATLTVPDGSTVTREIIRHPGAVGIVAVDANGDVVLERQYRAALDANLLEIPAGKRDVTDEPSEDAARRELVEETGLQAGRWSELGTFYNSPGFADEHSTLFLTQDLVDVDHDKQGPEEEAMEIVRVPLASTWDLIASGDLIDGKSIIGLLLALHHLER
jgi:ADP-ribose pyrophosphatase